MENAAPNSPVVDTASDHLLKSNTSAKRIDSLIAPRLHAHRNQDILALTNLIRHPTGETAPNIGLDRFRPRRSGDAGVEPGHRPWPGGTFAGAERLEGLAIDAEYLCHFRLERLVTPLEVIANLMRGSCTPCPGQCWPCWDAGRPSNAHAPGPPTASTDSICSRTDTQTRSPTLLPSRPESVPCNPWDNLVHRFRGTDRARFPRAPHML
jgi:hypothetical protein